ncbi:hypothetical protein MN608_07186 [Microdochium nivale]|nr:hypothetical protein MN608_07186 [Microdochium nivale]
MTSAPSQGPADKGSKTANSSLHLLRGGAPNSDRRLVLGVGNSEPARHHFILAPDRAALGRKIRIDCVCIWGP